MNDDARRSRITPEAFRRLVVEGLPSAAATAFEVVRLERGLAVIRRTSTADDARPGGTVAGPVLFALADLAMYAAVLSERGEIPMAVTTDATVHFLRRPRLVPLVARARLLKSGRALVVGDIEIAHEGEEDAPVTHAVMTYSVPSSS